MKRFLVCSLSFLLPGGTLLVASDNFTIPVPGVVVTGVRSTSSTTDDVVITASYTDAGTTSAAIYSGSLAGATSAAASSWVAFAPTFIGQSVTSSTFYGPNTSLFTPSIGEGNIIAVGSYKYAESPSGPGADHGMIYQGPVNGVAGTWTQIDATPLVTSGTLINTIAHSNMGSLVVGNYDTSLATGNAFIYNRTTEAWTNFNPSVSIADPDGAKSVTAYGIWQNSLTDYTIAGGLSDVTSEGLDEGYLANYDASTGLITNYKTFNYNNAPLSSIVSHFDGITITATGFNLTGDYTILAPGGGLGAFFASVTVLPDGSFSDAVWTDVTIDSATFISGNTVLGESVLGIYTGTNGTLSYIVAVPEPTPVALLAIAAGIVLLRCRRKS